MTNEANDIYAQAKNGSVAAIIQVLNEKLTDSGVRTRAIYADGMLQLLCEGQTLDQLEQPVLVERIRYLLENISPRTIRRVNIYSRIVREQQLLWLDEINRDRENQVLWSEEITLKQPSLLKRLQDDWVFRKSETIRSDRGKSTTARITPQRREHGQFWRGLVGGAIVTGVLLGGWWLYQRYGAGTSWQPASVTTTKPPTPESSPALPETVAATDPFADAVRLAEQTSRSSQTARSAAEWLNLAAQWQQASDYMAQVAATDPRYKTAQNRVVEYRRNSEIALQKAKQSQVNEANTATGSSGASPDSSSGSL
jgi:hypothetical protein